MELGAKAIYQLQKFRELRYLTLDALVTLANAGTFYQGKRTFLIRIFVDFWPGAKCFHLHSLSIPISTFWPVLKLVGYSFVEFSGAKLSPSNSLLSS